MRDVNSLRVPDGSLWEVQQAGKRCEDRNGPWSSSTPPCSHFSQLIDWLLDAYWRAAGDLQRQEASWSTGSATLEETSPLTNPAFLLDLIIENPFYIIVGWFFYFQLLTNWNSFPLNAPHSWAVVREPEWPWKGGSANTHLWGKNSYLTSSQAPSYARRLQSETMNHWLAHRGKV